ncbi:adhesion G protein-coupled receptor L4-like [Antedon mediterranea]|uniref:adhesion G protein-coupled receptor L4-like n=1 Tax=Antedon mediterranea TaxID=105859 RepID=UPI003AF94860
MKIIFSPNPNATFYGGIGIGEKVYNFTVADLSGNIDFCEFRLTVPTYFTLEEKRNITSPVSTEPDSIVFWASTENAVKEDGPFVVNASLIELSAYTLLETVDREFFETATDVVTLDIFDRKFTKIRLNCRIHFPILKKIALNRNLMPVCHFTNDDHPPSECLWATDGCVTVYEEDYYVTGVTCRCSHLTSFVILMKPKPFKEESTDYQHMSTLTKCGLVTSTFFLITTLVIICCFRELRRSDRFRMLRHLVMSLLCVNILFLLLESDANKSLIACSLLAGSLHYSLLASVSWMVIISTDLYIKIKHPFQNHERRLSYVRFIGWIIPAIIVGITAVSTRDNYASDKCWLSTDSGAIWAFIAPVCLAVLIVLVQLLVIGYVAYKKSQLPNQSGEDAQHLKRIRTLFSGILLLTPTVGLWWIFGVVVIFSDSVGLEYIFVTMNSFQGLFIWFTQCVLSKEVRDVVRKSFNNRVKQSEHTVNTVIATTN